MFVDSVKLKVQAGKGGNGLTSFRREKFIAKGGPDGGDGGKGGDIVVRADNNLNTLAEYRHLPLVKADDGEAGKRQKRHGKNGQDRVLRVPVGTAVFAGTTQLADLTRKNQSTVIAQGGRGGFGNAHFTSSTRQAPRVAELGEPGEARELTFELKLLADVGLVGLPNAGKSTLLSVISSARPKIASYPFTTLEPHLGVVDIDQQTMLVADIPGLIAGASRGKGLGHEFLRHIERTAVILHLIDATSPSAGEAYKTVEAELASYGKVNLTTKPQLVILSKTDGVDKKTLKNHQSELTKVTGTEIWPISAATHKGLTELLRATIKQVQQERKRQAAKPRKTRLKRYTLADDPNAWWVEKQRAGVFIVKGQRIEGFARRTDMSSEQGVRRLRDILHKQGIDRELVRLGVALGDTIKIAGKKLKW